MSPHHNNENNLSRFGERTPPASAALNDYLVLDLTRVRSGPTCVRQLADWGADVIKIEAPSDESQMGGPRDGPDFQNLHRNKRSLTLNLKTTQGKKIFMNLAQKADVIVENFRPDVKHRLGIDYDSLVEQNPGLICASISGFGLDQFSELKAYKVNDDIFCLTDSSTISLTISTPLLCPLLIFSEFEIAHLPLPSIIIAICLAMFFCLSFDELAMRLTLNF